MRHLHLDMVSGIAGDMALAALAHLGAPLDPLRTAMDAMGLGAAGLSLAEIEVHGIRALRFRVDADEPGHHHRSWRDIRALLQRAGLSPGATARAERMFEALAAAEARVHGGTPEEVQFHEVGGVDSIADMVGCALALEHLAPQVITASPPVLGRGVARSRHGAIPVPAPATLEILRGIPARGLDVQAELTTPTGAAILATQVDRFCCWPALSIERIGYGAGTRDLGERPNLLRVVLGEGQEQDRGEEMLVEANIDDMNPEHFEHLLDALFAAGAHDAWLQPVIMKKSRPAVTVGLLCDQKDVERLEGVLLRESTTIGVRRQAVTRRKLARRVETVTTRWGPVRMKLSGEGDQVHTAAPEHDDCRARAREHDVPLKQVYQEAVAAWHRKAQDKSG